MKNTAQYKFTAKKIIAKLEERLDKETNPLYADWLISLMREGFKKQDAVEAFRRSKFILLADGSITTKERQKASKRRQRGLLIQAELDEAITDDYSVKLQEAKTKLDELRSFNDAQQKMIEHMHMELMHTKEIAHKLEYARDRSNR